MSIPQLEKMRSRNKSQATMYTLEDIARGMNAPRAPRETTLYNISVVAKETNIKYISNYLKRKFSDLVSVDDKTGVVKSKRL